MPDRTETLVANKLESKVDPTSARFEKNMRAMADLVAEFRNQETAIHEGGGAKAIESQHKKGRLTARERIALLVDPGTELFELGVFAAHGMYEDWGGAPAAGVDAYS
jgi:3-methylcrotonyl-CoA carboxylase beta subunit